jgi:hypothetical protein
LKSPDDLGAPNGIEQAIPVSRRASLSRIAHLENWMYRALFQPIAQQQGGR